MLYLFKDYFKSRAIFPEKFFAMLYLRHRILALTTLLLSWQVRPMHARFVEPSKQHADVIVPVGLNQVALDLIISRLRFAANA